MSKHRPGTDKSIGEIKRGETKWSGISYYGISYHDPVRELQKKVSELEGRVRDLEHPNSLDAIVKKVK